MITKLFNSLINPIFDYKGYEVIFPDNEIGIITWVSNLRDNYYLAALEIYETEYTQIFCKLVNINNQIQFVYLMSGLIRLFPKENE